MNKETGRFFTNDNLEREELTRGTHDWFSRPELTGSESLIMCRVEVEPGNGHPFHRHPTMDEIIYVLSGEAEQWLGEERRVLGPGEAVYIPRDAVHGVYNAGDGPLTFLAVLSPAGDLEGDGMVDVSHEEPWCSLKEPLG